MCNNKQCPINYGDVDCEFWKENECQYVTNEEPPLKEEEHAEEGWQ